MGRRQSPGCTALDGKSLQVTGSLGALSTAGSCRMHDSEQSFKERHGSQHQRMMRGTPGSSEVRQGGGRQQATIPPVVCPAVVATRSGLKQGDRFRSGDRPCLRWNVETDHDDSSLSFETGLPFPRGPGPGTHYMLGSHPMPLPSRLEPCGCLTFKIGIDVRITLA